MSRKLKPNAIKNNDNFIDDIMQEVDNHPTEIPKSAENCFNSFLKERAKTICIVKKWIDDGAKRDHDKARMVHEYINGELNYKNLLELPCAEALEILVENQAHIFWLYNGAQKDDDQKRILNDYFDAKRYIGFLIAESLIENCKNKENEGKKDCFEHYLRKEYLKYLECLSVEEYIRIKAYFYWQNANGETDNNASRISINYFDSLSNVRIKMVNCKKRSLDDIKNISLTKFLKDYLSFSEDSLEIRKRAKINCNRRLQAPFEKDVGKNVDNLYQAFKKVLEYNPDLTKKEKESISGFYENTHIPNMLEYVSKCLLCAFI